MSPDPSEIASSGTGRGVLELDALRVSSSTLAGRLRASFTLRAGELALVRSASAPESELIANAAVGVAAPVAGAVRFLGRDWSKLKPDARSRLRARIGRVFSNGAWLDHLSLADNIVLPAMYHTHESQESLHGAAAELSRRFSLPGIPTGRPSQHSRQDLRRAACVRALLGSPALVVLEEPTDDVYPEIVAPLLNSLRVLRDRGTAVLWFAIDRRVWRDETIAADRRLQLFGGALTEIAGR